MQLQKGDPRHELSRRTQEFHEGDPALQAALRGEEFFDVTPGHFLSTALETGYFDTVDDCLEFFELERDILRQKEPFDRWQIKDLESSILADADERLRPIEDASYEAWAESLIATKTLSETDRTSILEALLADAQSREPSEATVAYADKVEEHDYNAGAYHSGILALQGFRLLRLLEREGFAITAAMAADSLVAHGLLSRTMEGTEITDPGYRDVLRKLGTVSFHGLRREVEAGIINPNDFDSEDWDLPYDEMTDDDLSYWAGNDHPIVLGARDIRLFASHYASADELPTIVEDEKYQTLMALIKNTPRRIAEVQASVRSLRD